MGQINETVYPHYTLANVGATLALAAGIEAPAQSEEPIPAVLNLVKANTISGKADKLLIFNPDAVALWLYLRYTDFFAPVQRHTQLTLPMRAVMPSVTPVCFGTIYTGAMPAVHGIQKYEKPVIKTDSFFDSAVRAGKKTAICAVDGCSMSRIFLEREIDYFITESDLEAAEKALKLINEDDYDIIVCYQGNYDSTMHGDGTEAQTSLDALLDNAAWFDRLVKAFDKRWAGVDRLCAWITDHGAHDGPDGRGSHGKDIIEDMNVTHFWGVTHA